MTLKLRAIRYDYHVFEAPHCPRMAFGCTADIAGYECSREAFLGRTGSLERPFALRAAGQLSNSTLPIGGHGCGVLGVDVKLARGEATRFAYCFSLAESWEAIAELQARYRDPRAVAAGFAATQAFWEERLSSLQARTGEAMVDRFINTWNPYNCQVTLAQARIISTDHMGLDGLRYRDTTQDALAVSAFDPAYAAERLRLVYAQQTRDGGGCFSFFPHTTQPATDEPHRSDNTVWQIYTLNALLAETGETELLDERIPFRDGGDATIYEHTLRGLRHIAERRGPHGLPTLFHADWNDGLALFQDEAAESVMLGMQLVHSCREFHTLAARLGRDGDAAWCTALAGELTGMLNTDMVWDGGWYRRLLLSNGKVLGSSANRQGKIYINPQSWSVISGVGDSAGRGIRAMDSLAQYLDTPLGLVIVDPPFTGIPEPEEPAARFQPGHRRKRRHLLPCQYLGHHRRVSAAQAGARLQILPAIAPRCADRAHRQRPVRTRALCLRLLHRRSEEFPFRRRRHQLAHRHRQLDVRRRHAVPARYPPHL